LSKGVGVNWKLASTPGDNRRLLMDGIIEYIRLGVYITPWMIGVIAIAELYIEWLWDIDEDKFSNYRDEIDKENI
jgi:hypothetical protein